MNDRFYLVDLPGYGYAKVAKSVKEEWGNLVRGYLDNSDDIRLLYLLLDVRRAPGQQDLQMHDWTSGAGIDEKIVLTKTDKLSNQQLLKSRQAIAKDLEIEPANSSPPSAVTKAGIEEIRREMFARL